MIFNVGEARMKSDPSWKIRTLILAGACLVSCATGNVSKTPGQGDGDGSAAGDGATGGADGDSDNDGDTDTDTDNDTDGDTDTDGDSDASGDAAGDGASDVDGDTDGDGDSDGDSDWGDKFCGQAATIKDTPLIGIPPSKWSDKVTMPDLGKLRVMEIEIAMPDRKCNLGGSQPFSDLTLVVTSPTGTQHTFWKGLDGNKQGNIYAFPQVWRFPQFWDENLKGDWTLSVTDNGRMCLEAIDTLINSWCFKPLAPTDFDNLDAGQPLEACNTTSQHLNDYDTTQSPAMDYPVTSEITVDGLIKGESNPEVTLDISHASPADLEISLIVSNGGTIMIKSQGDAMITSPFVLSGMQGKWMTGRYQLKVVDLVDNGTEGDLVSWCVRANQ